MAVKMTLEQFRAVLPSICDKETSCDPQGWEPENPLWGHCAVVALLAQDIFGGKPLRASLAGIPVFERMRSHYWNKFPDGTEEDFTRQQFGKNYPSGLKAGVGNRKHMLSSPKTRRRYELLAGRFAKAVTPR